MWCTTSLRWVLLDAITNNKLVLGAESPVPLRAPGLQDDLFTFPGFWTVASEQIGSDLVSASSVSTAEAPIWSDGINYLRCRSCVTGVSSKGSICSANLEDCAFHGVVCVAGWHHESQEHSDVPQTVASHLLHSSEDLAALAPCAWDALGPTASTARPCCWVRLQHQV